MDVHWEHDSLVRKTLILRRYESNTCSMQNGTLIADRKNALVKTLAIPTLIYEATV